nr:MAG TPA: holin [Caudoviricetes sp.]
MELAHSLDDIHNVLLPGLVAVTFSLIILYAFCAYKSIGKISKYYTKNKAKSQIERRFYMKENAIKAAMAAALGALCAYGVQLLVPVLVLVVVMLLDYATGMTKAWNAGELSSRVGLRGILKKVGYLVIVAVAAVVDWLLRYGADTLGWDWPVEFLFASIVIIWLVINELLSILENVSAIGAPVPGFLQALLKKLKVHAEDTAADKLPGEEDNE